MSIDVKNKSIKELEQIAQSRYFSTFLKSDAKTYVERLAEQYGEDNIAVKEIRTSDVKKPEIKIKGMKPYDNEGNYIGEYESLQRLKPIVVPVLEVLSSEYDNYMLEFMINPEATETWKQTATANQEDIEYLQVDIWKGQHEAQCFLQPRSLGIMTNAETEAEQRIKMEIYFRWFDELESLNR